MGILRTIRRAGLSGLMLFFLFPLHAFAQQMQILEGKVTAHNGEILPYASVSIDDLEFATITDINGVFELELPQGWHLLEISYLGYLTQRDSIFLQEPSTRLYTLEEVPFFLDEQLIQADAKELGRKFIRNAIREKKNFAVPFPEYRYQAYTKTVLRFPDYFPFDSILNRSLSPFRSKKDKAEGNAPRRPSWLPPELDSDILYLSENLSEVSVLGAKKSKELILHSRVSGDLTRFSFVGNLVTRFDPYQNRTRIPGVTERGLISPLSDRAFFFYDYELEGYYGEGKDKTYKIAVKPKRKYDPVFSGYLYLADSSWAIKKLELWATKDQYLSLLDSLWVRQEYLEVEDKWVPFRSTMAVTFSFDLVYLTVPFHGEASSLLYDYDVDPKFPKKYFNREVLKVTTHTNTESRTFLDSIRPMPLSRVEERDYQLKDSLRESRDQESYQDSLRKEGNRVTAANVLLLGQSFSGEGKWNSVNFEHLLSSVGFNPMEGWFIRPHLSLNWGLDNDRQINLDTKLRYGFSEKKFSYSLGFTYNSQPKYQESFRIIAGNYISEFSRFSQVGFWPNTQSTLLYKTSLMRLYRKAFAEISYGREIINGLSFDANVRYENRSEMPNLTDFSWFNKSRTYEENLSLPFHQALIAELNVYIQPFNTYISAPTTKYNLGSSFPLITLNYTHGFGGIWERGADFSKASISLSRSIAFGMIGNSQWRITAGKFFNRNQVYFPDYYHVKSNKTFSRPAQHDAFFLLEYYEFSTAAPFVEAHLEHEFSGFIFNKIPFVRKLKFREFAGLHYMAREGSKPYLEANVGLEKIFLKVLSVRFDLYFTLISHDTRRDPSLKFLPPNVLLNLTK